MPNRLHQAATDPNGFLEVKRLIEEEKVDPEALDTDLKMTAVYFAAKMGSLDTLRYLIEVVNVNLDATGLEHNLLFYSFFNPSKENLFYLRKKEMVERFNDGTNPLQVAVLIMEFEKFKELTPDSLSLLHKRNKLNHSALYYAIKIQAVDKIDFILSYLNPTTLLTRTKVCLLMIEEMKLSHHITEGDKMDMAFLYSEVGSVYGKTGNLQKAFEYFTYAQLLLHKITPSREVEEAIASCRSYLAGIQKDMTYFAKNASFFKTKIDASLQKRLEAKKKQDENINITTQSSTILK